MDIKSQLKAAGVEIIFGNMRFLAALRMSSSVPVEDGSGQIYLLSVADGKVNVQKTQSQGQMPVCLVRITDAVEPVPTQSGSEASIGAGVDQAIYSFRAETEQDAKGFLDAVHRAGHEIKSNLHPDADGLPDVEVELHSNARLDQLQDILHGMVDSHVMLQTLRPVALAENSLERDYDL